MTLEGTNFNASSTVRFNGSARTTTYVTTTQITAQILLSDLVSIGSFNVTVFNNLFGGQQTSPQVLTVSGIPVVSSGNGGLGAPGVNALPPLVTVFQTTSPNLENIQNLGIALHSLIKLPDDGDVNTQSDSAIYYVGSDGKRHAFPSDKVYFTWYEDFSGVQIINPTQLATIPLGSNVTYKPGKKMVKFTTDNKVYAVDKGGILRWITTEAAATELYGPDWNTKIDDISDAFYSNYTFGANITGLADFNPSAVEASVSFPSDSLQK